MRRKAFSKWLAFVIALVLCVNSVPVSVFATELNEITNTHDISEILDTAEETTSEETTSEEETALEEEVASLEATAVANTGSVISKGDAIGTNGYYNVISKKDYDLVPGAATETEIVVNNSTGTRRQVLHVIEVDPSNPDVSIVPGYYQIDKDVTQETYWSHKELTEMAKYYEDNLGYNIVGGMNTDLYYDTYAPRILVYNGQDLSVKGKTSPSSSILYVFEDAAGNISCEVKAFNRTEFDSYLAEGTLLHAVSVSFGMVVKEGELVTKTEERTSEPAARSMVGVKADGTLVICMNDGRGANNSVGLCNYEEGEIMLALGCEWAANCDGGGSSTFLTKRVGEENFTMRSVPCDGAQRPTAHGIFVASNVAPTGELGEVEIDAGYDYFAPNSEYTFDAEAIDTHGYAMDMPGNSTWKLSDESYGTISNGTFKSNGKTGEVEIQVFIDGNVLGSKKITIADPEIFELSETSTVVPYSTADKVRTISIPIVATIGEDNVFFDTNSVEVTLSDAKAGTLDGFKFTATSDTTIVAVDISVKYTTADESLVYSIEFGQGSEIIYDFEDGDTEGFVGFADAKKWSKENGVNNTLVGSNPLAGQFNEYLSSETFISTTENGGQVRNGNSALAWRLDNTDASFANWSYNVLFNTGETIVLRDVENGKKATALGMWLYIPKEAFPADGGKGLSFQSQFYTKNADGSYACKQDHFMFTSAATGNLTNLNSATEADIPESRWVYASIDISKYDYLCTPVASDEGNSRSPSFIRTYVKPVEASEITFYIDDITLDYSSAVDDRILPTISAVTYATADTAISLENDTVISGNTVGFAAKVADNSAIDAKTGKIYIDGVEVASQVSGGALSCSDVTLVSGSHKVTFEIKDELGNIAATNRTFTIEGDAEITLTGHNDSGEAPKAQSIYYVDIDVANIGKVNTLVVKLKLQNANLWEGEGAVVANGFEATYDYNEVSELLTVIVECVDSSKVEVDTNTLVSIPVRVWTYNRYNYVTETYYNPAEFTGNKPVVNVECEVESGKVIFADKTNSTFSGELNVATELTTISSPYHIHDVELTVLNKTATSTESGYEGRTYCETCQSVVGWGTVIEATGHNYEIIEGQFVCSDEGCGHVYEAGTGIFEFNGDLYYSIAGKLMKGWQYVEDGYCFANTTNYKLTIGEASINGVTYNFGEDGITEGAWIVDDNGIKFSYGPDYYRCGAGNPHANVAWAVIGGETYAFDRDGYRHEGIRLLVESNNPGKLYEFTDEGALIGEYVTDYTGIFQCNGMIAYLENGTPIAAGLVRVGKDYYYINSGYIAVTGSYNVTRPNGLLPAGTYEFGEDGKMINPPEIKNGPQEDGTIYIDGVLQTCYQLVEYDGYYYFVNDGHKIAKNTRIYLSAQFVEGTELKVGYYEFDADGKMLLKNGPQEDGYFYINGIRQSCYQLVEYEGHYYFINDGHKLAKNIRIYLSAQFVEGAELKVGYYDFDADGKLLLKNGPQEDGYFYINGIRQSCYQLLEYEGHYYFINDGHKIAKNTRIYLSAQFVEGTELKVGYYDFDADGKLLLKNGPQEDGYFYINGIRQSCYQLVEYEGYYYFINDSHKIAKNTRIYLSAQFVEGTELKVGYYDFDADGKLLLKNGPQEDGYFYINGIRQSCYQLVEYKGYYYFIDDCHKIAKNKKMHLNPEFLEGTYFQTGYYEFDTNGRMIGGLNGLHNGRDIGEIPFLVTTDGYDIKEGLLLRAGETDGAVREITDGQKQLGINHVKEFGIKTEMDLRFSGDGGEDLFGESILHKYYDMVMYEEVFTEEGKDKIKEVFTDLANPDNYPVYLHCTYGADRAGTVCYILEALLGVSEENARREYLLSIGSYGNAILRVRDGLELYEKETFKECAEAYLLDCGVTLEQINSIRDIFLVTN